MVERIGKLYELKNGYKVAKTRCYDGFEMRIFFSIFEPSGSLYMSCGSYEEAYELASNLRKEEF